MLAGFVAMHLMARYWYSAGMDTRVNLAQLPDFTQTHKGVTRLTGEFTGNWQASIKRKFSPSKQAEVLSEPEGKSRISSEMLVG